MTNHEDVENALGPDWRCRVARASVVPGAAHPEAVRVVAAWELAPAGPFTTWDGPETFAWEAIKHINQIGKVLGGGVCDLHTPVLDAQLGTAFDARCAEVDGSG